MIDPYRMVVVNLIAFFILLSGSLFYKFIYPRKEINLFVLLIFISILPIISIFREGIYESGDFNIHIYRSIEFYRSLSQGNIMPSWAGEVNATFGLPLFIFNYTLPYYIISFIHFLGFNFINSLKLFLAGSYILSGIFMFMFTKKIFKNVLAAFTSSIFYLFAPYHLIDLHFKVVIGELLAFTIMPLLFFFIAKIQEKKEKTNSIIFAGLSFAALVASHVFIAFIAGLIIVSYGLFICIKNSDFKIFLKTSVALLIGSLISAYIWLTPFFMSQYTIIQKTKLTFVPLENVATLFYSPWRMGFLFQGPRGEIANLIGYTQLFIIFFILYRLLTKKFTRRVLTFIIFWLAIFAVTFFLILPISKFAWEIFPFIKAVGQHRLLVLVAFLTSILAGYMLAQKNMSKLFAYVLIGITIFYTIPNWGHRRMIPNITDSQMDKEIPFSTYNVDRHFYANSRWVDEENPYFNKIPEKRIEIIEGKATITELKRTTTKHTYHVDAQTNLQILENTLYFPGWSAKTDEMSIDIFPSIKGTIAINLPKGNYNLIVNYKDILIFEVLKKIGLVSIIVVLGILSLNYLKLRRKS